MIANFEEMLSAIVRVAVREEVRPMREMLEIAKPAPSGALLSVVQASRRAGVSTKTLRAWIKEGKLCALHSGRAWRIEPDDLERFLRTPKATDEALTPELAAANALRKARGG